MQILILLLFAFGFVPAVYSQNFTNPVIYEDFADNDVSIGPDGAFYLSASNMHYVPGAPILKSWDLVNWKFVGHSVPTLISSSRYNMTDNQTGYVGGTWASTLRYRKSNGLWYWIGCIDFWITYIYTSSDVAGPWKVSGTMYGTCYYDCGLLIDDDDTMYVVHGNTNVNVSQLSPDGFSEVKTQHVFSTPEGNYQGIEGNRMYKINGTYYVLDDSPQGTTFVWKSESPWGPWINKILIENESFPALDACCPDQGSLIQVPNGTWYFMSFVWAYPAGRMPILAPLTWDSDGFPVMTQVDGGWGASYPYPLPEKPMSPWTGKDTFNGNSLGLAWEWNQNPDTTKFAVNDGLTLYTATVTDDLYHARNTLTHRIHGQFPVGTIHIDFHNMNDGDYTGLAAFRDHSAWIGIVRNGHTYNITAVQGLSQNSTDNWATLSTGTVVATVSISRTTVWLRVALDARANGSNLAEFYYSIDGTVFTQLGGSFKLETSYYYFMGYRYGIFNYATKALGGSVDVLSFTSDDRSTSSS